MNDLTFDHLTRRASLAALGAAGVAGLFGQATTTSGKQSASKKAKKKAQKKCENQVDQCVANASVLCDNEDCRVNLLTCCPQLGDCNFTDFFTCALKGNN
jgi:hypothetical protein